MYIADGFVEGGDSYAVEIIKCKVGHLPYRFLYSSHVAMIDVPALIVYLCVGNSVSRWVAGTEVGYALHFTCLHV